MGKTWKADEQDAWQKLSLKQRAAKLKCIKEFYGTIKAPNSREVKRSEKADSNGSTKLKFDFSGV
jgi:hypothetical protein